MVMCMRLLEEFEPKRVLYHFEEITKIPRGSRHTKEISDWLVTFAREHKLEYRQDALGNVVIRKPASSLTGPEGSGQENNGKQAAPVILQGHIDMVCEKDPDCTLDMEKEGLHLVLHRRKELDWLMEDLSPLQSEDDWILKAEGTTLGGDDGIAVAYMLALLEAEDIPHPPLECIFTVDEEIGMLGASGMDLSDIQGRLLLNVDSEDEGHLLAGCAGGCTTTVEIPVERDWPEAAPMEAVLTVTGLQGGHSGIEIDRGRANASMLLGRILQMLFYEFEEGLWLVSVNGGSKDNAIPRTAEARLLVEPELMNAVLRYVQEEEETYRKEYGDIEPLLQLKLEIRQAQDEVLPKPMDRASARRVVQMLRILPNGIQKMSFDIPGLVETSLNLGILVTEDTSVSASFSVRSSVNSEKWELINRLDATAQALGGSCRNEGEYSAWEYRKDSRLRDVMQSCYQAQYGKPMIVETIHAGVECGIFADELPGLDAVSFGPELRDIHTPRETMDLASVERTWRLILSVLKEL